MMQIVWDSKLHKDFNGHSGQARSQDQFWGDAGPPPQKKKNWSFGP